MREMVLQAVEIGHEHHASLVETRRRLEDVTRQRHGRREDGVERRGVAASKSAQRRRGSRRDRIEDAEQRIASNPARRRRSTRHS